MTKKNIDPKRHGRRHHFRPIPDMSKGLEPMCRRCIKTRDEGNHIPVRADWKMALQTLALEVIITPGRTLVFRPIEIDRITRNWPHPLAGKNVVQGLKRADLVIAYTQGDPRPPGRGQTPSWYRLTPEGVDWLLASSPKLVEAVRAARAGGSVSL